MGRRLKVSSWDGTGPEAVASVPKPELVADWRPEAVAAGRRHLVSGAGRAAELGVLAVSAVEPAGLQFHPGHLLLLLGWLV